MTSHIRYVDSILTNSNIMSGQELFKETVLHSKIYHILYISKALKKKVL